MSRKVFIYMVLTLLCVNAYSQGLATISGSNIYVNNGVLTATINGGIMTSLKKNDGSNILANGGSGYFSYDDNDGYHSPSNSVPSVNVNNAEMADFYYTLTGSFIVEMHYVFRKNESGFYTYYIIKDNGVQYKTMTEVRFAIRADKNIFNYGWTCEREGNMVTPEAMTSYVEEVQDATFKLTDGSIYTKYDWSVYRKDDLLHGLLGNGAGIWNIEASREYVNGGPTMQELTVHSTTTTPILLTYFQSGHYGSQGVYLKREYSTWSKIYGPTFIYVNTGTSNSNLIEDAKSMAKEKEAEWPYTWLTNTLYPLDRGTLTGTLKMTGSGEVDSAYVFLTEAGPSWITNNSETWQLQPYSYFFGGTSENTGYFNIKNIRPGTYTMYAYTQKGKLVNNLKVEGITISAGTNSLGDVVWNTGDKSNVIFQVGKSNHKSDEFAFADLPRLYGRWKDTPVALVFNTATNNDRDDWYYCQRVNTLWDITFNLSNLSSLSAPTLKFAIAGVDDGPHLDVLLNSTKISTIDFGSDSGIRRSSLTGGKYSFYSYNVNKNLLHEGANTLTMKCYGSTTEYKGLMYDAILMESDVVNDIVNLNTESLYNIANKDGSITIHSNAVGTSSLHIYTMTGLLVYKGLISTGNNKINLFSPGIYILILKNGDIITKRKIIA
ncbi:MAG: polysaccharide lyase family protein [Paludibacter sp.]|nr:polysaccharide lyase family protein [Paludibacter sp.]